MNARPQQAWLLVFFCWLGSTLAVLGSLFFSEVMKFEPCVLCWYQRIAMFPLAVIFAVGFWKKDPGVRGYAWPFIIIGVLIAVYHNLLYYGFIPKSITPCTAGVSCTEQPFELLGFITIPFLSLTVFVLNALGMLGFQKMYKGTTDEAR